MDFLGQSGFAATPTIGLIRDLACLLSSYREEDVPLFPDVFVIGSLPVLSTLAPGTQRVTIGEAGIDDEMAPRLLKRCAGLACQGWGVYVALVSPDRAEFGLFRALRHSYATSAEESMKDLEGASPVVLIRNRGRLVVELVNAKNQTFTASFTSAPPAPSPLAIHVHDFAIAATALMPEGQSANFRPYFERLMMDLLQRCHGTLMCVHAPPLDGEPPPRELGDGVWLNPPVDLASLHTAAAASGTAEALADLQAMEALLSGMVNSDGLVVLGTQGQLLAYSVFLKPNDEEKRILPEKGGGRRRTYELMRLRLGTDLRAAFFRSQDGETDCQRVA
jgi:hypothetical protein